MQMGVVEKAAPSTLSFASNQTLSSLRKLTYRYTSRSGSRRPFLDIRPFSLASIGPSNLTITS